MTTYTHIARNKRRTFFLILVFIVFILFIGWIFSAGLGYGPDALVFAGVISIIMAMISYFSGDKVALWSAGAVQIQKEDNPYVWRLIENLCIGAGMQMPKVYIISEQMMNAFATGRDPKHASIALTTGIIENLENEELEGVIAHELSHIQNYDIRVMTVVIVCVGMVALLSDFFLRFRFFGGHSNNKDSNSQIGILFIVIGIVLAILSPVIAQLIQLAVSRKREFLADASGALMTRYPDGLIRALEKIDSFNTQPMRRAGTATAHLYIANPFGSGKKRFSNLFSTHPPISDRIQALRTMGS